MKKLRLDALLVERGLFASRTKAQAALMAGKVLLNDRPATKAGTPVKADVRIEVLKDAVPYVSRGGLKLAAGLDAFRLDVRGRTALDLGASTGGFTDCLLQRGAAKVYAVDVGHGQLDSRLREDPRVICREKTHAKNLTPELLGGASERIDLAVIDVSFISLTLVLPPALACLQAPCEVVALIKPQFELEPKKAPKGVVRQESYRREAVEKVRAAARGLGLKERGLMESPVKGPKGNVEFLLYLASTSS
ncbi:MAG: TlyA family RNA methyltransferase [Elusimicrobiota bacterium]